MTTVMNRETWLLQATDALALLLKDEGKRLPKVRVACSWPARRGLARKNRRIGECWAASAVADGAREIYISPTLDDEGEVLETLLHELCHAVLDHKVGHKKPFAQLAKSLGLEGKPTATYAGDSLKAKLAKIADDLGPYPHSKILTDSLPKQTTRLLKVICPDCGYVIRVTNKWIETGLPVCSCGTEMVEDTGDEVFTPLLMSRLDVEYNVAKADNRYTVRYSKVRNSVKWTLIDWDTNRMAPVDSREEALDLIDAIQVGLTTLEKVAEEYNDLDAQNDDEIGFHDEDTDDILYLSEDEEEDDLFGEQDEAKYIEQCRLTGREYDPVTEDAYTAEQTNREGWVKA